MHASHLVQISQKQRRIVSAQNTGSRARESRRDSPSVKQNIKCRAFVSPLILALKQKASALNPLLQQSCLPQDNELFSMSYTEGGSLVLSDAIFKREPCNPYPFLTQETHIHKFQDSFVPLANRKRKFFKGLPNWSLCPQRALKGTTPIQTPPRGTMRCAAQAAGRESPPPTRRRRPRSWASFPVPFFRALNDVDNSLACLYRKKGSSWVPIRVARSWLVRNQRAAYS